MSENTELPAKQEQAAAALAAGASLKAAAAVVSVEVRTLYRWRTQPAFQARLDQLRGEMIERAVGLLSRLAAASVIALARSLRSADEAVRVRAATAILDRLISVREHAAFDARLRELEEAAASMAAHRGEQTHPQVFIGGSE
ncbi:MAG: hypothetical protein ACOYD1_13160 [Candidatus Nanopelagicales bacterium]